MVTMISSFRAISNCFLFLYLRILSSGHVLFICFFFVFASVIGNRTKYRKVSTVLNIVPFFGQERRDMVIGLQPFAFCYRKYLRLNIVPFFFFNQKRKEGYGYYSLACTITFVNTPTTKKKKSISNTFHQRISSLFCFFFSCFVFLFLLYL